MSKSSSSVFSFRNFVVSAKSLIHFDFIFVYGIRKWSSLIHLHTTILFSNITYCRSSLFPHCIPLPSFSSVQFTSVTQLCPTVCHPMDYSMPGLPVPHQLLEFTQTHVHWVTDAIQPSHPLSSPSPPTFNLSQHQGLFQWVSFFFFTSGDQCIGVSASTSVLPMNTQDWSPLRLTGLISLQSKGLSRIFSNTTVQKHQFFSAQLSS